MGTEPTENTLAVQQVEDRGAGLTTERVVAAPARGTPTGYRPDRWLLIARAVWPGVAILALGLFLASLPARYLQLLNSSGDVRVGLDLPATDPAQLSTSPQFYAGYNLGLEVLYALLFFMVALFIFGRVHNDRMALLASLALLTFGTTSIPTIWPLAAAQTAWHIPAMTLRVIGWFSIAALLFLFPNGRFAPRWTWWALVVYTAHLALTLFPSSPFYPEKWPVLHTLLNVFVWGSGVLSLIYKYRHVLGPVQRQQTKWVVFGMVAGVLGALATTVPLMLERSPGHFFHQGNLFHELVHVPLLYSFLALIPLSIGISIVHYRLWDIDVIINRTLVYLALTGILAGLYSASMVLFQKLSVAITGVESDAAVVLTTLVLASVFTPVKEKVQAVVDKSYKQARDPASKLKMFNAHMALFIQMNDVRELTHRALDEVVDAFGAQYGVIDLYRDPGLRPDDQRGGDRSVRRIYSAGSWPHGHDPHTMDDAGDAAHGRWLSVPLRRGDKDLGFLRLGPSVDGAPYRSRDRDSLQRTADLLARTVMLAGRRHRAPDPGKDGSVRNETIGHDDLDGYDRVS